MHNRIHLFLFTTCFVLSGAIGAVQGAAPYEPTTGPSLLFSGDELAYLKRLEKLRNENGLYVDRSSDPSTVSTAATGLGVLALAEAASRGLRDTSEVKSITRHAFEKTVNSNPAQNRGWLSHFTDANGVPRQFSEVSTIDTAIFFSGLLHASRLLSDFELESEIRDSIQRIDTQFVLRDGVFLHGFYWSNADVPPSEKAAQENESMQGEPKFIPHKWNDSSEGMIIYRLFDLPFPMHITRTDYPLFVYAYPLCFYDDPTYDQFLQAAIEEQIKRFGYWGVTATDGPHGYVTADSNVISPVLIGGIATKYPKYLEPIKSMSIEATFGSMHVATGWTSTDDLTIDLTSAYILFSRWSRQGQPVLPSEPSGNPLETPIRPENAIGG